MKKSENFTRDEMKNYQDFSQLFKKIDINPKNLSYYQQAFTHKTFANENPNTKSYDMLEFLGDAIIQMKSSLYIFQKFSKNNEGTASLIRANNVSSKSLAFLSQSLNLSKYLLISKGSESLRDNVKVNADLYESLCAAIYLDLGDKSLDKFLYNTLYLKIENTDLSKIKDAKSSFQEYIQTYSNEDIEYKSFQVGEEYKAELIHDKILYGIGYGPTKKKAEDAAAKDALKRLNIDIKKFL